MPKFKYKNMSKLMHIQVVKEHLLTKNIFPLGLTTVLIKTYSTEERVSKGWKGHHATHLKAVDGRLIQNYEPFVVADVVVPIGNYNGVIIKDGKGVEYDGDWFYRTTGQPFSSFFDVIEE